MLFSKYEQERNWKSLMQAIEEAPEVVPCGNYPDLFYVEGNSYVEVRQAKEFCKSCPVKLQCSEYALKWEDEGIWGGLTARERIVLRNKATGKSRNKRYQSMPVYNRSKDVGPTKN